MKTRNGRIIVVVAMLSLMASTTLVGGAAASDARDMAAGRSVSTGTSVFTAQFAPELVGGRWMLETHSEQSDTGFAVLADGSVPANGIVTATVPTPELAQSTYGLFSLDVLNPIPPDASQSWAGHRTVGVPVEGLGTQDVSFDLGFGEAFTTETQQVEPGDPSSPNSEQSAPWPCEADFFAGTSTCLLEYKLHPGIAAMRGWSGRARGMTNEFSVTTGAEFKWQNASRVQAGPFSASGTFTRRKDSTQTDGWGLRGDCWDGTEYDLEPCSAHGHHLKFGRDTWRWERRFNTYCDFLHLGCVGEWQETLFNYGYDGGTETAPVLDLANYYKRPSSIRAGLFGRWSRHEPDSFKTLALEGSYEHADAAEISVSSPEYGSASFSSTMTDQRTEKVTNHYVFRRDLPFFNNGSPPGNGWWYRYDMGSDWKEERFSCEWAPGWGEGADCWENGS